MSTLRREKFKVKVRKREEKRLQCDKVRRKAKRHAARANRNGKQTKGKANRKREGQTARGKGK